VVGENGAALDALRHCEPGRAIYLWGAPGVGRSHLLQAVCARPDALYHGPGSSAAMLKSIATGELLRHKLIAIDNVEFLDDEGQAALFALYNRWREVAAARHGFTLVLAGDHAPMAMLVREDL